MKHIFSACARAAVIAGLLTGGITMAVAQDQTDQSTTAAPDNTKVNKRDRNSAEATADQQKDNRSDRDTTKEIRKALTNDKSLSTYAHNVKVVTQNGMVTLKGPVRSEDEKKAVESKAAEVAGADKVTSQLDIKPEAR